MTLLTSSRIVPPWSRPHLPTLPDAGGQVRREGRRRCRRIAELAPLEGVERPRRVVRFARLIHQPVRVLGVPSVRAASGGSLKPALVATKGGVCRRRCTGKLTYLDGHAQPTVDGPGHPQGVAPCGSSSPPGTAARSSRSPATSTAPPSPASNSCCSGGCASSPLPSSATSPRCGHWTPPAPACSPPLPTTQPAAGSRPGYCRAAPNPPSPPCLLACPPRTSCPSTTASRTPSTRRSRTPSTRCSTTPCGCGTSWSWRHPRPPPPPPAGSCGPCAPPGT